MKRVIVHVDQLVLKGSRHEDRYAIGEALREGLGRQFSTPDALQHLASRGDLAGLKVSEVRIAPGGRSSQLGSQAARSIAQELKS